MTSFRFACPRCRSPLEVVSPAEQLCPVEGHIFRCEGGIWQFLPPGRLADFRQFIREYRTVRRAEGRGSQDPAYYRSLPLADLSGRRSGEWRIRAATFAALVRRILIPLEKELGGGSSALDLGAGNGWLAYHLARRGWLAAAVDISSDVYDGLGAWIHYDAVFTPIQAEFDHLPFTEDQVSLAIFNASLHYAADISHSLAEALRVLRPGGLLVVLDTPIYADRSSGDLMVAERRRDFEQRFGFRSDSLGSEEYLSENRLSELEGGLGLRWKRITPLYGLRWSLRPWIARLRGRREPARFEILSAVKPVRSPGPG